MHVLVEAVGIWDTCIRAGAYSCIATTTAIRIEVIANVGTFVISQPNVKLIDLGHHTSPVEHDIVHDRNTTVQFLQEQCIRTRMSPVRDQGRLESFVVLGAARAVDSERPSNTIRIL